MTIRSFIDGVDATPWSLVVINRDAPEAVTHLLTDVFADQPVAVDERTHAEFATDTVALYAPDSDPTEPVATSPLSALNETLLLVNSDLYTTGARGLADIDPPDVLVNLDDTPFRLQGYPQSDTEKLLLVVMSRYIEHRAWQAGQGTLRASFQRLSRLDDEQGTRRVYESLAATDVETHAYGYPDWTPPSAMDIHTHGGTGPEYRTSWFVIYTPPEAADTELPHGPIALLAIETGPQVWEGFWTERPSLVADLDDYVATAL